MSSCSIGVGSKDSNATFVAGMRDSSDMTTFRRQNAIRNNYRILHDKGQSPLGGISSTDFQAIAHTTAAFAPANTIISGLSYQPCVSCTGQIPFNKLRVPGLVRY